jgi:hypothetical protein
MDSDLGMQYMITRMPTLFTFDRGEVMEQSRTKDVTKMKDKEWLKAWIEREARRRCGWRRWRSYREWPVWMFVRRQKMTYTIESRTLTLPGSKDDVVISKIFIGILSRPSETH